MLGNNNYLYLEEIMFTHVFRFTLLLLVSVALFVACGEDDNPIVDGDNGDEPFHADADGFILKVDGNEIYRQFQGTHEGSITLKVGDELDVVTVFLDNYSDEFFPEAPEGENDHDDDEHGEEDVFALALSGLYSSIIEVHLHESEEDEHDEAHDEEGEEHDNELAEKFTFEVKGLKAGQTELKLQLMHGGHPDFTAALLIPVTVTP